MLDANSVLPLIVISLLAGFLTKLLLGGMGKVLGILGAFPFILFLLNAVSSGTKIENINELPTWVNWFIENWIVFFIVYTFEGVGAGFGKKLRKYIID